MNVCVVGTGYVGLVTGTCLAYLGRSVICVDKDERKINLLKDGQSPIYEPGLSQMIASGQQRGYLHFTTDLAEAVRQSDVVFIAVGTPPLPSGRANLSAVEAVARSIGQSLDNTRRRVIVNKSTVPIGSGNWVEMLIREGLSENPARESLLAKPEELFLIASNPEFLREGSAIHDTFFLIASSSARPVRLRPNGCARSMNRSSNRPSARRLRRCVRLALPPCRS